MADESVEDTDLVDRITRWLCATQGAGAPSAVSILGLTFQILPGVFSPAFYPETAFFASALHRWFTPGVRFLDLGCGIGVNTVIAARAGAEVIALDINEAAVANTVLNAKAHGQLEHVDARTSDVFGAVHPDERFDLIYWNVPFTYRFPTAALTPLEESIFDPGYRKNREFITAAHSYLSPGGTVLMGISPTLGLTEVFQEVAASVDVAMETVAEAHEEGTEEWLQLVRVERS